MTPEDDMTNDTDLESGTQPDVETPPKSSGKGLKGFATKKGPKLARARKKNPVTLSNKATKPSAGKKV